MMPGGEENQGSVTEWIGEATQKCYGTSAAAAYAAGVLALYMSNPKFQNSDRAKFLAGLLTNGCSPCNNQNANERGLGLFGVLVRCETSGALASTFSTRLFLAVSRYSGLGIRNSCASKIHSSAYSVI